MLCGQMVMCPTSPLPVAVCRLGVKPKHLKRSRGGSESAAWLLALTGSPVACLADRPSGNGWVGRCLDFNFAGRCVACGRQALGLVGYAPWLVSLPLWLRLPSGGLPVE